MRENIHSAGSTMLPQELMLSATGEHTNPSHYLEHLRSRFCPGA
jgi:Zn-dependent M32 family carboxypeptidase